MRNFTMRLPGVFGGVVERGSPTDLELEGAAGEGADANVQERVHTELSGVSEVGGGGNRAHSRRAGGEGRRGGDSRLEAGDVEGGVNSHLGGEVEAIGNWRDSFDDGEGTEPAVTQLLGGLLLEGELVGGEHD